MVYRIRHSQQYIGYTVIENQQPSNCPTLHLVYFRINGKHLLVQNTTVLADRHDYRYN
jgi:hypothetical protein